MSHSFQHPERREVEPDPVDPPVSVSHLVHVLRAYSAAIVISLLSVGVAYAVCAILLYLLSPAQRTTVQPFRLEFRGASEGTLPNGIRFTPTEIVGTPVLLKVYQANDLKRFTPFNAFSRSVFVLESNREYEKLVNDYQARLSDPRLTPLDRDRIQKEFESKRESISKSDYALSYARTASSGAVPESLVRKVLGDILTTWAEFAVNEQHALDYRVAVLSPQIVEHREIGGGDAIATIEILRSKIYRVLGNIDDISKLPGSELVKTSDGMSLTEVRMRLEDIIRFRLEPLVGVARASGLVPNPPLTIHFLQNQLAYDERRLQAARATVNATRDALAMYSSEPMAVAADSSSAAGSGTTPRESDRIMPQLSDNFLDRLVALSKQATESQFRQQLVEEYQAAIRTTIPLEQTVSYEKRVLDEMKSGAMPAARTDAGVVRAEIDGATNEVRVLIAKVNEVYRLLSRNLNPTTQLVSLGGAPPTTRIERTRSLSRLALYGVVLMLISLPVIVLLCLLHNRMREEEEEALVTHADART
jgi:hypothetical protein